MGIKRSASYSSAPCKYEYSKKDGNGGQTVMAAFPLRCHNRTGRETTGDLRDERGNIVGTPKSVSLSTAYSL